MSCLSMQSPYFAMRLVQWLIQEVKSKSKGTFQEKHIYFKYTETKLISLFNTIPLDFNAPVPAFHKFFLIPSKKKFFWLRL
jgi:hypothetical protein